MTREQIQKEISEMDSYLPVSKIEERLNMPPTTLQKVLSGKRELPKKWLKVLEAYFVKKGEENNKPENKERILKERNTPVFPPDKFKALQPILENECEPLPEYEITILTERKKQLEFELAHPVSNPIVGMRMWKAVRENEIKEIELKLLK